MRRGRVLDVTHLDVATDTAAAGWPVFPCLARGDKAKRPSLPKCKRCEAAHHAPGSDAYQACAAAGNDGHGLYDATTDPDRIHRWWTARPDHLIGTPTAGLVVVDLDTGAGRDTAAWWAAQIDQHGAPPAPEVATPSGGRHIYYRAPDGHPVRNSASKLAPGVDIRADGGYVIAPGSTLPDGRAYVLEVVTELDDAPAWLLDAITAAGRPATPATPTGPRPPLTAQQRADRYARTALESELGRLATARQGGRNHQLNESAYSLGQLVGAGRLDAQTVTYELVTVALRIGLTEAEAAATIASGLRAGIATPRRTPA